MLAPPYAGADGAAWCTCLAAHTPCALLPHLPARLHAHVHSAGGIPCNVRIYSDGQDKDSKPTTFEWAVACLSLGLYTGAFAHPVGGALTAHVVFFRYVSISFVLRLLACAAASRTGIA